MEGATTSYASVQEEGPPTSSDFDAIGLFMPQRAGARRQCGPQHVIWMLWLLFVSAVALTVSVVGGMCFLDRGHACYFYISPLERAFARASYDSRVWWRLAESVIFTTGIVGFLRAAVSLLYHGLRWRRTKRLRHRVVGAMSGITSRTEATRKLMSGLRSVMAFVHE